MSDNHNADGTSKETLEEPSTETIGERAPEKRSEHPSSETLGEQTPVGLEESSHESPVGASGKDLTKESSAKVYKQHTECPDCGRTMQVKHLAYKHRCGSIKCDDLEQRALKTEQRAQELFRKRVSKP